MNRKILIASYLFFFFYGSTLYGQHAQRKALMGMMGKAGDGGIIIDSILPGFTFEALGARKGDKLISLNNAAMSDWATYARLSSSVRTGDQVTIKLIRNSESIGLTGKAVMRPYEKSDDADILYDWVPFRSGYLRTITRKPKAATDLPCILYIPGYGCGSIENYSNSYNGKLINAWLKAGYAVVTIEKSGLGDSYDCEPCGEVDLVTDIQSFDVGYRYMEKLPFVNTKRLYVWGHSMGGVIAPEVAKLHQPKGVMVFGATFRPWSEFLLEMHRVQKPLLENQTMQQTETFIRKIQKIYYEFFVLKKSPAQLHENAEYRELVASELNYKSGSNDMWGRHWRYWQQIDSLNLTQSWQQLTCPVLIVHGETDYEQCSIVEPKFMQQAINSVHPGNASMVIIPELDHFMMKSSSWETARDNFRAQQYMKGNFNNALAEETVRWLNKN